MTAFEEFLTSSLREVEQAGLRRQLRVIDSAPGSEVVCAGRRVMNFSSNDYLGLAAHPRLREAAAAALQKAGTGSGASRLVCGNHRCHEELEAALARFKQAAAALSFSTGYAAALGTIPALMGKGDVIILDKLCHASLVDGARLSGATLRVFPHNQIGKLESHLKWAREKFSQGRILVVAESVYSMDGDRAPLADIVALKERYGAWLFLDEAHAVGVISERGRGLADELGLAGRIEVQMGTLGKALGSGGAYICGSVALRDFLINRARSFIFSTAPPPAQAAAALAAVELLEGDEGAGLLQSLRANLSLYAPDAEPPASAIFPLILGGEAQAMKASRQLLEGGYLVPAIRYPTVPRGLARLRVVVTAAHTAAQIQGLTEALKDFPKAR